MNDYHVEHLKMVWQRMRCPHGDAIKRSLPVGIDGMRAENWEKNLDTYLSEIARRIHPKFSSDANFYNFGTMLMLEQRKSSAGHRTIYIPRLRDQLVLRAMHEDICRAAKEMGICLKLPAPTSFVSQFRESLTRFPEPWIFRTDIVSFYDSIPRDRVIAAAEILPISERTRRLLHQWSTNCRARRTGRIHASGDQKVNGLPTGLSISSSLSELWAHEIDRQIDTQWSYFRYVDDIAVVCGSRAEAEAVQAQVEKIVHQFGLALSDKKTEISCLTNGVTWLGLNHEAHRFTMDPERVERWLRQFSRLRKETSKLLREVDSDSDQEQIVREYHKQLQDEICGRTSYRPAWYAMADESGEWRAMDRMIHSMIRSIHRQAGMEPPSGKRLPSLHRAMLARKKRQTISAPSKAD